MKIYKSQATFEIDIKDGKFFSKESIDISAFDLDVEADIEVWGDINASNIDAISIKTRHINAKNINVGNIMAMNINANNISAHDIKAWDINAKDISAIDIKARNIYAENVTYYSVAFADGNIKVKSIRGGHKNAKHFVLNGKLEIEDEKNKIVKPYSTKKIWICPSCDVSYKERKILDICPRCDSVIL